MKKSYYLVCLTLIIVFIGSCKSENITKDSISNFKKLNLKMGTRPLPPGDPNLDANWDWTQSNWLVYFNNADGNVGSVTTLNPFLDGSQKVYGSTNPQKADMYPQNGWMLVARDFGTPTSANSYPFIVLYNKFRGIMRVCMLRTYDVLSSQQQITVSYASTYTFTNLFRYSSTANANDTKSSDYKQTAVTNAGVQEWMVADFDVRGYSLFSDVYSAININMSEIAQSDVSLNGNIQLEGTAQPQAAGTSNLNVVKDVYNFFTSSNEGISKVTALPPADVAAITSGGISVFLKSILNLVTGFSGGGGGGGPYSIQLRGKTNQTGYIKLTSPKNSFSLSLNNSDDVSGYKPVQTIPWGVFKIDKIKIENTSSIPMTTYEPDPNGGPDPIEIYLGQSTTHTFAPNFITDSGFIINPAIANDVAAVEISGISSGNFVCNTPNGNCPGQVVETPINYGSFILLDQYQSSSVKLSSGNVGYIALGIKITFKDGSIVYQTIPIQVDNILV